MTKTDSVRVAPQRRDLPASMQPAKTEDKPQAHLVQIPGADWAFWQWVVLRGAGFPAEQALELSAPDCAAAAQALIQVEQEYCEARDDVVERFHGLLSAAGPSDRPMWSKALRRLKKGKHSEPPVLDEETAGRLIRLEKLSERVGEVALEFRRAYQSAIEQTSATILRIAGSARFREAVIWQNRHGLHSSIDSLLRMSETPGDRSYGSDRRRREDLVANYLQRYCLKNDTIGFFGPVGWARFSSGGPPLSVRPGSQLLETRNVYLEPWGVDALADRLNRDPRFQPWIPPRRMSFARLDGRRLSGLPRGPFELTQMEIELWSAADGLRTAREIAVWTRSWSAMNSSDDDIFESLRGLEQKGVLTWHWEACLDSFPERSLRLQLERIGDRALRQEALDLLEQLERGRESVASAAGDPERLDAALGELEEIFKRLTGQQEATRAAGQTYAGRTLVYEDCRRSAEVDLGPEATRELGRPLSLLLESARWFTYEVSQIYRRAFSEIYEQLGGGRDQAEIGFSDFWQAARPLIVDRETSLVGRASEQFERKWEEILRLPDEVETGQPVIFRSEELRSRVEEAFFAPRAGWQFARYHNPDVMIAAESAEAVQDGQYLFVLGEIHIGSNAIGVPLFMEQHPRKEELLAAIDSDMKEPRLMPLMPKYWPHATARLAYALMTERDYRLELAPGPHQFPQDKLVSSSELIIKRDDDGRLLAQTRDGRVSFDIIEAFAIIINSEVANNFKLLRARRYAPRVQIDRLVIARETWRFNPSEIWFAFENDGEAQFLEAQRWRIANQLPERLFIKASVEMKPFYADLTSPLYVRNLGKVIRRCVDEDDVVTVSEMLPGPGQLWLPDAQGHRYASELRTVAFDLKDFRTNTSHEPSLL